MLSAQCAPEPAGDPLTRSLSPSEGKRVSEGRESGRFTGREEPPPGAYSAHTGWANSGAGTACRRRTILLSIQRCWPLFLLCSCSCAAPRVLDLTRFEFSQPQMGLPFRIVLYAPDRSAAEAAARAAFNRIGELNDILSDYDTDSELSRLSQTAGSGQSVRLSDELWFVLERSQKLAEQTDGAFDVTVGPVVSLWRKARRENRLPDAAKLAGAKELVGYRKLRLDPKRHTAQLGVPYMRLDLGAIAKGYALDEVLKILRSRGITRALVSGGGDMAAGDPPPGKKGWRIEVAPLDMTNAPPARFILIANAGLGTSGDLFQHLEVGGKRYSHIVDPHTGLGLIDHGLVTVIARDGITADSLATAVSVLGPEKGLTLIEETKGAAAHIVRVPAGSIEASESSRFKGFYETPETDSARVGSNPQRNKFRAPKIVQTRDERAR